MRKFSLILAILVMSVPALARVDIICTQNGNEVIAHRTWSAEALSWQTRIQQLARSTHPVVL